MNVDMINIYRQLFSLKPPKYQDGVCLEIVEDIYMLTDDNILYDNLFTLLEPKRCCIPYFLDGEDIIIGRAAGTVEAILFYDKKYKVHYTTLNLYEIILALFQYELELIELDQIIINEPVEVESIIDESNCQEYDLCWDSISKTKSDLTTKGKLEFEEGDCSSLAKELGNIQKSNESKLDDYGYSVFLPENERWFILREAAEELGYDMVVNHINRLIAANRKKKIRDNSSLFKLEHDLKKLRRYY